MGADQLMQQDVATQADLRLKAGAGDFARGVQQRFGCGSALEALAGVTLGIWRAGLFDQQISHLVPLPILRHVEISGLRSVVVTIPA